MLDFALLLRDQLEKSGKYRVVMTRTDDTFIPLADRVRMARIRQAALFISIHADALRKGEGEAQGATVYTLSETASDAEAGRLAESENRADVIAGIDLSHEPGDVADILIDLAQRETKAFSMHFAKTLVGEHASKVARMHKNPLKSAGFKVLKAPDVPSVLIELGYVSSKDGPEAAHLGGLAGHDRRRDRAGGRHLFQHPDGRRVRPGAGEARRWPKSLSLTIKTRDFAVSQACRGWDTLAQSLRTGGKSDNVIEPDRVTARKHCCATAHERFGADGTSAMRLLLRFFGFLFAAGTILFLVGVGAAAGLLWHFSKDLPDYSQLQDYEPPVMTRVHAADGSLVAEYANQRRLYIPIQAVPKMVINAFLAAEDKNFYEHNGLDFGGIARAGILYVQNYGSRPPAAGRLDHHPAGRQELPADQRGLAPAQDQGGAARAQDRAHLFQGEDPRALSQRDLSRRSAPTASRRPRCSISTSRCTS